MREIKLTQGYTAQISNRDFARVSQYKWYAHVVRRRDGTIKNVYGESYECRRKGLPRMLHRFILGVFDPLIQVDHNPDYSGLNCQRGNIRTVTSAQNNQNRRRNRSGFKGVSWNSTGTTGAWVAFIKVPLRYSPDPLYAKNKYLGRFADPKEAAKAYDIAAVKYFGKYASTNKKAGLLP